MFPHVAVDSTRQVSSTVLQHADDIGTGGVGGVPGTGGTVGEKVGGGVGMVGWSVGAFVGCVVGASVAGGGGIGAVQAGEQAMGPTPFIWYCTTELD